MGLQLYQFCRKSADQKKKSCKFLAGTRPTVKFRVIVYGILLKPLFHQPISAQLSAKSPRCRQKSLGASSRRGSMLQPHTIEIIDGRLSQLRSLSSTLSNHSEKFDDMTSKPKTFPRRRPIFRMDSKDGTNSIYPRSSSTSNARFSHCVIAYLKSCISRSVSWNSWWNTFLFKTRNR